MEIWPFRALTLLPSWCYRPSEGCSVPLLLLFARWRRKHITETRESVSSALHGRNFAYIIRVCLHFNFICIIRHYSKHSQALSTLLRVITSGKNPYAVSKVAMVTSRHADKGWATDWLFSLDARAEKSRWDLAKRDFEKVCSVWRPALGQVASSLFGFVLADAWLVRTKKAILALEAAASVHSNITLVANGSFHVKSHKIDWLIIGWFGRTDC